MVEYINYTNAELRVIKEMGKSPDRGDVSLALLMISKAYHPDRNSRHYQKYKKIINHIKKMNLYSYYVIINSDSQIKLKISKILSK